MRYVYFAFLFLLLLPTTARAQATGSLSGQVVEARTGEPLPTANVVVTELIRGTAADFDGNYTIEGLPPGTYEVVARFVSFRDNRQTVTI